jgi:hypothetical protein
MVFMFPPLFGLLDYFSYNMEIKSKTEQMWPFFGSFRPIVNPLRLFRDNRLTGIFGMRMVNACSYLRKRIRNGLTVCCGAARIF